jgi:hypothetical protein
MRLLVAVLFFVLHGFAASAASLESWEDLKRIIKEKQVTNIDDLLLHLPDGFTKGYTLIYRTRGLNQESVSPRRPRVLLFGQNAKLVLVYNSHSTGGKAKRGDVEAIETLEFDHVGGRSLLREIEFDGRSVPNLDAVKVNPDRCLSCHAATSDRYVQPEYTVRGLWDPYNSWAGVYGSLSRNDRDFIKFHTSEFFNFIEFLAEKPKNPRYSFLPLTLAINDENKKHYRALTFKNGYSENPNQILGMYLADYNFHRVGNILADFPLEARKAFQYLIRGLTIDEEMFVVKEDDHGANATSVNRKDHSCLKKIASFLPTAMPKVSFDDFAAKFQTKMRSDYAARKALVEVDNMGLTKTRPGFDPLDPFDEDREGRDLNFDSVNSVTPFFFKDKGKPGFKPGYWGGTALFYLFYLMDLPSQDINTAIARGTNMNIDDNYVLSGSTSLVYGNSTRCFTPDGKNKPRFPDEPESFCFSGAADEFFTFYLPPRFYQNPDKSPLDPDINKLTCDELANRSEKHLKSHFAIP